MANKKLLFIVEPGKEWMGGVYYVRNFLKTLSCADWIQEMEVHVLCPEEHEGIFKPLEFLFPKYVMHRKRSGKRSWVRFLNMILGRFSLRFEWDVFKVSRAIGAERIYPVATFPFALVKGQQVHWIPDFQHLAYPEYFSEQLRQHRNDLLACFASSNRNLILSSQSAVADFVCAAPSYTCRVSCVPFIAEIQNEISKLDADHEMDVLKKYGLIGDDGRIIQYFYVPNQFWKHKNHAVVVDALGLLKVKGIDPYIVCTGSTQDFRNPDHFAQLMDKVKDFGVDGKFIVLSMLSRMEQMAILKNCAALIQPSKFEGWGTGVQEAKCFGKHLILSDIGVHREQGGVAADYFAAESGAELAAIIERSIQHMVGGFNGDMQVLREVNECHGRGYAELARDVF